MNRLTKLQNLVSLKSFPEYPPKQKPHQHPIKSARQNINRIMHTNIYLREADYRRPKNTNRQYPTVFFIEYYAQKNRYCKMVTCVG